LNGECDANSVNSVEFLQCLYVLCIKLAV